MNDNLKKYQIKNISPIDAPNFTMNVLEFYKHLPEFPDFSPKRIYWITNTKGEKCSGQHAHSDDENELFVVIQGKTKMVLDDDGSGKKTVSLSVNDTVWVPRLVWHGFENLSADAIVLALTTTNYDPERKGYVEDYREFKKIIKKGK
jgi:dTDP-4-dehydrorhamnose 3,5-epimerase-like enzyme